MKNKLAFLWTVTFALFLSACSEDNEKPPLEKQVVQFALSPWSDDESGGRTAASQFPEGSKLLVTLTNKAGEQVLTREPLELLYLNDEILTKPIELPHGRYWVQEFFVVNGSQIIYATPKHGALLADAVVHPLPFSFVVQKGLVETIALQVINTANIPAKSFGYATFSIDVINPIPIAVFTEQDGKVVLTDAMGSYHANDGSFSKEFSLQSKINYVPFDGPHDQQFSLVVTKEGYKDFSLVTTYDELMKQVGTGSLRVVLHPEKFTIVSGIGFQTFQFTLGFRENGSVKVVWGDGTEETVTFDFREADGFPPETGDIVFSHTYADDTEHTATVTGDLEQAYLFETTSINIKSVDLSSLSTLIYVRLNQSFFVDLQIPSELFWLEVNDSDIMNFKIDFVPVYTFVKGAIKVETMDKIVSQLHTRAFEHQTTHSIFDATDLQPPITDASMALLTDLQERLEWTLRIYN